MTKFLLRALMLTFLAWGAQAAAPSVTCTPSRTSGTAPLGVIFDCSGTTDADTTKPFHDLHYEHVFGDTGAGTWANGARAAVASKNYATGPIAAHVYETCTDVPGPCVFTATHQVFDGTTLVRVTNTITVANPDTTYAGTATWCIFNSTVGTGCPSGATERSATSDWDVEIAACRGTTKRCLFKRGDTFTASASGTIVNAGPMTIGAYGSGAKPIVNLNTGVNGVALANDAVSDLRIMDIDFVGTGVAGSTGAISLSAASATTLTILRVTSRETQGSGFTLGAGSAPNWRSITNSIVQESTIYNNFAVAGIFVRMFTSALLGNLIGPVADGEFPLRVQRIQNSVIAHNTIQDSLAAKAAVTIRADNWASDADRSIHFVFSDNKVLQGTRSNGMVKLEPTDPPSDNRIVDAIVERNWVLAEAYTGATACNGIYVYGLRLTVRNNLIDLTAPTTCNRNGVLVGKTGETSPVPDDVNVYNNTVYSSATATTNGVNVASGSLNTLVKNTLCWFDNGTVCLSDSGTSTVAATNSSTAQATGTDPSFDGPTTTPAGFRVGTGSYAATGGTAIFPASNDDFFNCDDNTANERIGAFIPRARARCRSAAGP